MLELTWSLYYGCLFSEGETAPTLSVSPPAEGTDLHGEYELVPTPLWMLLCFYKQKQSVQRHGSVTLDVCLATVCQLRGLENNNNSNIKKTVFL